MPRSRAKVPEVVVDSRSGPPTELAYVAYKFIPATPLSRRMGDLTTEQWSALAQEVAAELRTFNGIRFEGFGDLASAWRGEQLSWTEFVRSSLAEGHRAASIHKLLPAECLHTIETIFRRISTGKLDCVPSLVWADLQWGNILVDEHNRLAGLIDFEGCLSGDGLTALGFCFARYGSSQGFEAIRTAWPFPLASAEIDRISLYAVLRVMRVAPYAHTKLPTGLDRKPLLSVFPGLDRAFTNSPHSPELPSLLIIWENQVD